MMAMVQAPELVVNSPEAYVQTAIALGRMPERLAAYRANLRQRFQASAVMDGPGFVTAVEQAYLAMFSRLPKTGE
jgi:predicted O-linked N-acetylglucosamine transferase (SPINDLY family)